MPPRTRAPGPRSPEDATMSVDARDTNPPPPQVEDTIARDLDEPDDTPDDAVLVVAENALGKVLDVRNGEEDPASLALRVAITGVNGVDFTYDLAFEPV